MSADPSDSPYTGIKKSAVSLPSIVLKSTDGTYVTLPYFDSKFKILGENTKELLAEFGETGVIFRGHRLPKLLRDMAIHQIQEVSSQPNHSRNRTKETHCFVSDFDVFSLEQDDEQES